MKASKTKKAASWSDVKARLTHFDRDGLVGLVHDLYTANKDNQVFLHARFGLGEDVLEPYKATINRWLWPDMFRNQNASVAEAKKAIANYKKAIGQPDGLAELHAHHQFGIDRGPTGVAIKRREVMTQIAEIKEAIDASQQVALRNKVIKVERVEQLVLHATLMTHHVDSLLCEMRSTWSTRARIPGSFSTELARIGRSVFDIKLHTIGTPTTCRAA